MEQAVATAIAEACGVTRDFHGGGGMVRALRGIDLRIQSGELVALRGRSGSGKTTLLNILIGLDNPTEGQVFILGEDMARLSEAERARLRRQSIGMMFQNAHLFPSLTAQENVEVPLRLAHVAADQRERLARQALEQVGLSQRALVHAPRFVVADEPTGNIDSLTGRGIAALLRDTVHQLQIGLLVATHDVVIVEAADRVLQIHDGRIVTG
jgi:ABC-type lipoprotein export system ATPase subunit